MYYTLEEAANVLSLTPGEVNRLREQGALRGFKDGATWKFTKDDVNKYLAEKIKKESSAGSSLLSGEGDEEGPTMLAADSSDFDAMFDQAAENAGSIVAKDDEFSLVKDAAAEDASTKDEVDELTLAPEEGDLDLVLADEPEDKPNVVDDELALAPEEGNDDMLLVAEDEEPSLSDQASALVEDEPAVAQESSSAVDLTADAGSDDDLLHLGSDSGLSLLDDVDVEGSNVSLGDEEGDLVLGGSGTGSGSSLNLSGDSGLELLGDSDGDFSLDDDLAVAQEESGSDDGIFELAPESEADSPVLNFEKEADSEAPTELAADDGIFELAEDVAQSATEESSSTSNDANSASQLIAINDSTTNPFLTEVDDSASGSLDAFAAPAGEDSDVFKTDVDSGASENPFGSFGADDSSSVSPFGSAPDMPSDASDSLSFDKSASADSSTDSFGASDFGSVSADEPVASVSRAPVASTNYTGKDLIFLVPCLLFLILATIGAYELCRTIWSYQEGSFDLTGPVLETIAKMVKLI